MIDALKWLRANLLPIIFGGMLLLQFLTWREIARFRYGIGRHLAPRFQ